MFVEPPRQHIRKGEAVQRTIIGVERCCLRRDAAQPIHSSTVCCSFGRRYVARKLQNIYRGRAVRRAIREVVDRNRLRCDIIIVDGKRFLVAKDPPRHRGKVYTYSSPSVGGPPPSYVGLLEEVNGLKRVNSDIAEEELDLRFLHAQAKEASLFCVHGVICYWH